MAQPIRTLTPGSSFRLAGLPERSGTLLRLGNGSAVVRYGGERASSFTARLPGEEVRVAFTAPLAATTISLGTMVETDGGAA